MHSTKWHDEQWSTRSDEECRPHRARKVKARTGKGAYKELLYFQVVTSEGDKTYRGGQPTAMSDARARARGMRVHVRGRRRVAPRTEGL